MPKILAIDPGGTTGVAELDYELSSQPVLSYAEQVEGGLAGFLDWYRARAGSWAQIVCEDFVLRPSVKFPDLTPTYIIGAIESGEYWNQVKPIYQSPSQKPLCSDEVLKRSGLYQRGKPHANDAIRHAIIYLRSIRHLPTIEMAWPKED